MINRAVHHTQIEPAIARITRLASLGEGEVALLRAATTASRRIGPHREIIVEGAPVPGPSLILEGWACRVQFFADGRRQILSFVLPGDVIGRFHQSRPVATSTIMALTEVRLCPAPRATADTPGLVEAYAVGGALDENYLFRQIARLGRLSAYDRIVDWMLEMRERLAAGGLADDASFPMPLTQEALGDALGLTSVHVNRTLQAMRRDGMIDTRRGVTHLLDMAAMTGLVGARPPKVSI